MTWIRVSLLILSVHFEHAVAENTRSITMSIMTGWQFQCANTTCLPFFTITVSSARGCQISCLTQVQCQAAGFQQSASSCQLFTNIQSQYGNMVADAETVIMAVMTGTRMPFG